MILSGLDLDTVERKCHAFSIYLPVQQNDVPTMVETKMARRLQACIVSSAGHGITKRIISPIATAAAAFAKLAGCRQTSNWPVEIVE
jgi:hypothetical protein